MSGTNTPEHFLGKVKVSEAFAALDLSFNPANPMSVQLVWHRDPADQSNGFSTKPVINVTAVSESSDLGQFLNDMREGADRYETIFEQINNLQQNV